MISAAKPPLLPTCSRGLHEGSEPAHHLRASLVNIVAREPTEKISTSRSALARRQEIAAQISLDSAAWQRADHALERAQASRDQGSVVWLKIAPVFHSSRVFSCKIAYDGAIARRLRFATCRLRFLSVTVDGP